MNVSLTPELELSIADKVATGMYPSSNEVIRAALQALGEKEVEAAKLADLRRAVGRGNGRHGSRAAFDKDR